MTGMKNPHEHEARERWGETEAWRESGRRTRSYTPAQVQTIKDELEEIEEAFAALLRKGTAPDAGPAREVAERARLHIDRWYYPCPPAMHTALAEMYMSDPGFRSHYEEREEGLAEFVARAVQANAARED
ncbi:MAG: TipAS antibiotic-recognition domain-containing protein [Gemmatimonadota bacterium]|jgi:hypothetical protein